MGVKAFFENRFNAALAYLERTEKSKAEDKPLLRDLELEAILEIIQGERLIHCHSYRQDEILIFYIIDGIIRGSSRKSSACA